MLTLDDAQTYTVVPVPMAGFTASVQDTGPGGITCTDVTITSTPAFCLVTFDAIPPSTTTTTTTTTTTLPATTTTGKPGQTTVTGSHFDSNRCTSHLDPNLQADAPMRIGATLSTDASPQPHFGDPITLSNTKLGLNIPAGLIQAGVNLELIKNNDQVPSTVTVGVTGTNTTEHAHTYVINTTATIHTVPVAVSKTYPKGQKALPLNATLALPDTHWTPVNGTSDVLFSENSLKILSHLSLPGIGPVTATFTCSPAGNGAFVALGATGAPATTGGGGRRHHTDLGGVGGGGGAGAGVTHGGRRRGHASPYRIQPLAVARARRDLPRSRPARGRGRQARTPPAAPMTRRPSGRKHVFAAAKTCLRPGATGYGRPDRCGPHLVDRCEPHLLEHEREPALVGLDLNPKGGSADATSQVFRRTDCSLSGCW